MKTIISKLFRFFSIFIVGIAASCGDSYSEPPFPPSMTSAEKTPDMQTIPSRQIPVRILAIGNSFTHNAATYMPWLIDRINGDSVYIAKLTRSGCSLEMHWNSHCNNTPDYEFHYSENGNWQLSDLKRIDDALSLYDWDIIVIQQASGHSGIYSTYQPYLDNLTQLIRQTNPDAKIAWHITWPYKAGTELDYFQSYNNDPLTMYESILEAAERASENLDIKIPSATLIWEMRQQYPEIEDQFSTDGFHISSDLALYALSTLWYECLVRPILDTSSLGIGEYPSKVDSKQFERAENIIRTLAGDEGGIDSVPMIHE